MQLESQSFAATPEEACTAKTTQCSQKEKEEEPHQRNTGKNERREGLKSSLPGVISLVGRAQAGPRSKAEDHVPGRAPETNRGPGGPLISLPPKVDCLDHACSSHPGPGHWLARGRGSQKGDKGP